MRRTLKWNRRGGGFTIIEVMIVIAIIVALGAVAALALTGQKRQADRDIARVELTNFRNAIKMFNLNFGRNPTDEEGLRVLWDKNALSGESEAAKWAGYLDKPKPNDPWGSAWQYRAETQHSSDDGYDLWSIGPDKQDGTEDDITNWGMSAGSDEGSGSGSGSGAPPPMPPPMGGGSGPR